MDQHDAAEHRIEVMLDHALRTVLGVLVALAVARAWQDHEHPVASVVVALLLVVAFALGLRRTGPPLAWLIGAVALWAVGEFLSEGFAWVAFPLYFLVLNAFPRLAGAVVVAAMAAWSVWCTGAFIGPVVGALAAALGTLIFGEQRADAQTHRALVAELREAQAEVAAAGRERGVLAERERLAREIHDTIGQGLASIVVLARTGGPDALPLIEATARDNLAEARRVVRALGEPGEVDLISGLQSLVDDARARSKASGHPLDVELRIDGPDPALPAETVQALQRGVQASLANVLQHAEARRCVVGLTVFADRVVVDIADGGHGFDPADVGPDSFGLRVLEARLAGIGGSVSVDTGTEEGTTIGLVVPRHALPPKEAG